MSSKPPSIVIFDTEFTAWQGSRERSWSLPWEHRELIQLAAVKVAIGTDGVKVIGSFNELVKPNINPTLSDYIIELTGINQSMLDNMAIDYSSCIQSFYQFCDSGDLACFAWGNDENILHENCLLNGIGMPQFSEGFTNLHRLAQVAKVEGAQLCSGELAGHLGLALSGHMHNALYDVRSIALALNHWLKEGVFSPSLLANTKAKYL